MFTPLEQFELNIWLKLRFFNLIDLSLTNLTLFFLLSIGAVFALSFFLQRRMKMVPKTWQSVLELIYLFVFNLVVDQTNGRGVKYFPFLYSLFFFILFSNLLGMVPFGFTITSHIGVTFSLSIAIVLGFTILGFINYKLKFLYFFVPSGVPMLILPFLVVIEIFSYLIRIFSLAIRLSANMMAGHTLLYIIGSAVVKLTKLPLIYFILPWIAILVILILEVGIAFLQAYVFLTLVCIYLNDVLSDPTNH